MTARGAELTRRLQQGRTRLLEDLLAGLSREDLEALARGLRALAALAEGQPVR